MTPELKDRNTLREFASNPAPYLERMRKSGEPVVLSVEGEEDLIIQDAEAYRRLQEQVERFGTVAAIREGLADIAAGRTRPAREVLAEIARKYNLPAPQPE